LIYLTNAASLKSSGHAGPGRVWAAMVYPPPWLLFEGAARLPVGAARRQDFDALQDKVLPSEAYLERCRFFFALRRKRGMMSPGALRGGGEVVQDGDTLVCTCPRPDSPKRTHLCHLEILAPALSDAGWRVVLYGAEVAS
jgi:hypothetical protein